MFRPTKELQVQNTKRKKKFFVEFFGTFLVSLFLEQTTAVERRTKINSQVTSVWLASLFQHGGVSEGFLNNCFY